MYQELKIVADPGRARRVSPKTREFTAYLLGSVEADSLWEKGSAGKGQRPVWIAYAATRGMSRPFTSNFRGGRRVDWGQGSSAESCLEIPKTCSHRWVSQDAAGGAAVTTAYLPELFQIEPVIPPERVTFISMPPRWWVDREAAKLGDAFGADAREVAQAALAAAYLDRRTSLPIVNDLRFQIRLFRSLRASALTLKPAENRWTPRGIKFRGLEACGLEEPMAVDASHDEVAALLTAEVRKFFEEVVKKDGKDRERQGRGVLPGARKSPEQLRLDFDFAVVA